MLLADVGPFVIRCPSHCHISKTKQDRPIVDSRRRLHSASTAEVLEPAIRRSAIGVCAPVMAGPRA